MKDRIKLVRKNYGLTQKEFAERLGIKQNTVASYEMGRIGISDNVIFSICREFGINEDWLRNGTEPMKKSRNGKLSSYMSEIVTGEDDFIRDLIEVYMELDTTSKEALKKIAKRMADKQKGRE